MKIVSRLVAPPTQQFRQVYDRFNDLIDVHERSTTELRVENLDPAAYVEGIALIGKTALLYTVVSDFAVRLRSYGLVSGRTADIARAFGVDPDPEDAVQLDLELAAGVAQYPMKILASLADEPTSGLPIAVDSMEAAQQDVTLILTYLTLEL